MFGQMTRAWHFALFRVNNFNNHGWWILYINAGLGRINLSSALLKNSMEEEF